MRSGKYMYHECNQNVQTNLKGNTMKKLLAELISIPGPCGLEHRVIRYLYDRLKDKVDEIKVDGLGNLIVSKKGALPGPHLVVSAHSDEVGFIVKKIEPNGLIRFEKLGGHDDRILLSETVVLTGDKGSIPGVIGTISAHMMKFDNTQHIRNYREMYIDCGAKDAAEVERLGIHIGDPITWSTPFTEAGESRAYGHAFDDRCGCALLAKMFEDADFSKVHGTVTGVFSTQEEVGLRGAETASHVIDADVALALDTTAVSDTFEGMMDRTLGLGNGAGIKVMDSSLIASRAVWKKLEKVAKENNIPYQLEIFTGIGTDAGILHRGAKGTPSSCISIPSRYAHSSIEMIDMNDFQACYDLFLAFIYDMRDAAEFSFLG